MTPDNMTPDIEKKIKDMIADAIADYDDKNHSFRSWRSFDTVSDQYSPHTGASSRIGFFGTSAIAKPTVTGSRGSNAALASLCTALSNLGLITNSTS